MYLEHHQKDSGKPSLVIRYPHFLLDAASYVCPGWPAVDLDAIFAVGHAPPLLFYMVRNCPRITQYRNWLE